jgi:glycosyltransferase involved in cell wall biosynthesis
MTSDRCVSIIICTCNRASSLRQTLQTLGNARVPTGWKAEVIVADNGSTDDTASVAHHAALANMEVHYLYEPKRGKSNALNAAMAQCHGDILLFTDDDVEVPPDWMEQMMIPLEQGRADAVVGKVRLAPHLIRPWLSPWHQGFLAAVDWQALGGIGLVGANMALRRSVLERVPAFDPELGPGSSGLANEETLFGLQLQEAGFKIALVDAAPVIHHLEASRLRRGEWLQAARKYGRTRAYIAHHWEHTRIPAPRLRLLWYWLKLHLRRILQPPPVMDGEGCPSWEMSYLLSMEECRQFCMERRRPRNYAKRGLTKLVH